ncbi:MAG: ATP-binding protein [Synergistaceae bacterium]|nr:ATP-binding protein [Synergistaceae bacterium]
MLFFRNRSDHALRYDAFFRLKEARSPKAGDDVFALVSQAAEEIVAEAERYSLRGDIWEAFFALLLAEDENPLGQISELGEAPSGSIAALAAAELQDLHEVISFARHLVRSEERFQFLRPLENYVPSGSRSFRLSRGQSEVMEGLSRLSEAFGKSTGPEDVCQALVDFYRTWGSGFFSLNRAFRWSDGHGLTPVKELDPLSLTSLVGYETQKKELLSNTKLFLSGRTANNVLLFGDSGTGKSSSVRALLNQPGFARRGLRIIEARKDQFIHIPEILDRIRFRNYRFILFMDDLSFEEFETEYKHLKALIEGGIEPKPENTVIYATSNRRNIVREVWADRGRASGDDVHGGDTLQEKLSLADRFGVTLWYGSVGKKEYMEMVQALIQELTKESGLNLSISDTELEILAMRWELGKGSFTGRTARQFVQNLLAEY